MSFIDVMHPACGPECTACGFLCKRADTIDSVFASRLAFMLECMLVDPNGHWDEAVNLLDAYKAEWEKVNPSPPTFMGEPMPPERKARFLEMKAGRDHETPNVRGNLTA
jgi:hypothetical protein